MVGVDREVLVSLPSGTVLHMGGFAVVGDTQSVSNDIFRSVDGGSNWHLVPQAGPRWQPRYSAAAVVVGRSTIVLLAGRDASTNWLADVWSSDDEGASWTLLTDNPGFQPRHKAGVVSLGDNRLLLCGGKDGSDFSDSWASFDGGSTWVLRSSTAGWGPLASHALTLLPSGKVLLTGGVSFGEPVLGIWSTNDIGKTWQLVAESAAYGEARLHAIALLPDLSLLLLGGQVDSTADDVYRSTDEGVTWEQVPGAHANQLPTMHPMSAVRMPFGSFLVYAALVGDGMVNDVWALTSVGLASASCTSSLPALCGAAAGPTTVTVSTDAAASAADPPSVSAAVKANVTYAPPVPSLSGAVLSTSSQLVVSVDFSAPVSGLAAADFVVAAGTLPVASSMLTSAGTSWSLTLNADGGALYGCPDGFTSGVSDGTVLCGKEVTTVGTWSAQRDACAPYSLATVQSVPEATFFASIRRSLFSSYW